MDFLFGQMEFRLHSNHLCDNFPATVTVQEVSIWSKQDG